MKIGKCRICGKKKKGKMVIIGSFNVQFFVCNDCLKKEAK